MKRLLSLGALACAFFVGRDASGQNAALMPMPHLQFFNANGAPLAGGAIYTCVAGSTCPGTPLAAYTDQTAAVALPNPIPLDGSGSAVIWIGPTSYKVVAEDVNGVVQWTQDNVRDLALLGQVSVSVKSYGAKGDDVTDDSAAIQAACTAVGTGTLVFPPATYKITSGNIVCSPGVTINGYGSTLDLTAASAPAFAWNVGGSIVSTAPGTLLEGFHVLGSQSNASTFLVRVDNVYGFTLRDVSVAGTNLAYFAGYDAYSDVENTVITIAASSGAAITYTSGTYPATSVPVQSHIDKLNCTYALTCVEADAGEVDISNSVFDSFTTGVHVNGARVSFRDGLMNLRNGTSTMRGLLIDSSLGYGKQTDVSNSVFQFIDQTGTYPMIGIDNNQVNNLTLASTFTVNAAASSVSTILRTSAALNLAMTKTIVNQYSANASGGVFAMPSSGSITGSITGSTMSGVNSTNQIYWLTAGSLGNFNNLSLVGNTLNAITALNQFNTGIVFSANWVSAGTGATGNVTFSMSGTNTLMTSNFFFPGATKASSVPQVCANNVGYGCT